MAHDTDQFADCRQAFFRRLVKDTAANTLAISAAAIVPLLAMVGGGVDASRYYMAESRLQAACDAGALAARHSMDSSTSFTKEDKQRGESFFDQNYQEGMFGLENLSRNFTAAESGEVNGEASGTLPTSVMGFFGYEEFTLNVACEADVNILNTDIMLVLDVTGSMDCSADGSSCAAPDRKIDNMRDSTLSLYDAVQSSAASGARIRYGIVPYSDQVNVGHLLQSSWMKNNHTYQSRSPDSIATYYDTETYEYTRTSGASNWQYQGEVTETFTGISYDQCVAETATEYDIYNSSDPATWTLVTQEGDPAVTEYTGTVTWEYYSFKTGSYDDTTGECTLTDYFYLYDATADITHFAAGSTHMEFVWKYEPVSYNVSNVFSSGSLTAPTGWDGANVTHDWNGCIEEASTVVATDFEPIPNGANDMLIDLVPENESERWAPMMPSLTMPRVKDDSSVYSSENWVYGSMQSTEDKSVWWAQCPKQARKLEEIADRSELEEYLAEENGFVADGATYHDIGMIWGARLLSPDGIMAADNASAPNGQHITRHIIFLTDGAMYGNNSVYSVYGHEWWDRRVTSDGKIATNTAIHAERFQAVCKSVRNKNISIWVVAFGTTLTQNLIDCATPGRAFHAADAEELEDAFLDIAAQIASLRITE